ncbi:succinylglutamate desuccinylase/aspartoacylase domain-containing protein [Polaromonas jejuensis]|uniref:Succinylglutamate desuccinylase/aspartoacylase family protein n=1 Tax=Polaromonas jejuensis TaxID=457502 RepID=A0ABW0QAR1_9BURK|nr:succinylglutamate desuccinylase/aspartoacylase family protein [Polaromonas jejuensis]
MSGQPFKAHAVSLTPPELSGWAASATGVAHVQERSAAASGPEVLVTALVHGNEYSGALALDEFLRSGLRPRCGRITAVFCNTAAFARFDASQPDASRFVDEDFNRVWSPERLDGARQSTELARAREIRPFVERATHLLDLHSMHEPCEPLLVTGLLPRNIAFAQGLGTAGQVIVDAGHADGVRMRDYGPFGEAGGARLALLLEAGQHWASSSLDAARNVLMRFLVASGALARGDVPEGWLLPDVLPPPPITVTDRVVAKSMDFAFVQDFRGGETIPQAGTVIAHDAGEPVVTPYDDCVLVMPSVRQLRLGVTTVRLGRRAG